MCQGLDEALMPRNLVFGQGVLAANLPWRPWKPKDLLGVSEKYGSIHELESLLALRRDNMPEGI
jgi:hypothetical protein